MDESLMLEVCQARCDLKVAQAVTKQAMLNAEMAGAMAEAAEALYDTVQELLQLKDRVTFLENMIGAT